MRHEGFEFQLDILQGDDSLQHVTPHLAGRRYKALYSRASARFQHGNTFGQRGGGVKHYQARLQREMARCATKEDIRRIYARLLAAALEGNVPAAKLLLAYACGQPGIEVELAVTQTPAEDDPDVIAQRVADFEKIMAFYRAQRDGERNTITVVPEKKE